MGLTHSLAIFSVLGLLPYVAMTVITLGLGIAS